MKALVTDNGGFEHQIKTSPQAVIVSVRPASSGDMSRLLGKKGAHFKALTALMDKAGKNAGKKVFIRTAEPHDPTRAKLPPFRANPKWPRDEITRLITDTMNLVCTNPGVLLDDSGGTADFIVTLSEVDKPDAKWIGPAVNTLFGPIGYLVGVVIAIDVR